MRVYERLLDCMPYAAAAVDREGAVLFVNRGACCLSGYSALELVGAPFTRFVEPADAEPVAAQVFRTIRTGLALEGFKARIVRKDGVTRTIWLSVHSLIEGDAIIGAVATAQDVTSRERADRQYRLFHSVVEHAHEAIMITEASPIDPPGPRIQYVNEAFTQMTAYTPEEVLGQTPRVLQGPDTQRQTLDQIRDALADSAPVCVELVNYRKDRSEYWTNLSIVPIGGHLVAFQMDVTERRRRELMLERKLAEANRRLQEGPLADLFPGNGPATTYLREQIVEAAPSRRLPVLVVGERGTGKALVAREIHQLSTRGTSALVTVDCSAIPGPLFESEMFGYEKGAFTGAQASKRGLFQQAHGGTLFLDEIGELSLEQQAKLLVAIQERRIRRVGGTTAIPVDVRIIAATNRDLKQMMADGLFRRDLYDRILGFLIEVPPLRDRAADLAHYVDHFVMRWSEEEGKPIVGVERGVLDAFHRYPWPGNVRELELVIGRMVARARDDHLTVDLLPTEIAEHPPASTAAPPAAALDAVERPNHRKDYTKAQIEQALDRHNGIVRRAARDLGIARNTLYRLMEKHGIQPR
jgi:PAS domain S-box-containing protein